jgi:hypothetical protein
MLALNHSISSVTSMSNHGVTTTAKCYNGRERFISVVSEILGKRLTSAELTGKYGEMTVN